MWGWADCCTSRSSTPIYTHLHTLLQADVMGLLQFLAEPSQPETPGGEHEVPPGVKKAHNSETFIPQVGNA